MALKSVALSASLGNWRETHILRRRSGVGPGRVCFYRSPPGDSGAGSSVLVPTPPYSRGSQTLLHIRLPWNVLKTSEPGLCCIPLKSECRGDSQLSVFWEKSLEDSNVQRHWEPHPCLKGLLGEGLTLSGGSTGAQRSALPNGLLFSKSRPNLYA